MLEPARVKGLLWPIRDAWLARDNIAPQARLSGMMKAMRSNVQRVVKDETHAHRKHKSKVTKIISDCDTQLGVNGSAALDMNAPLSASPGSIAKLEADRAVAVAELVAIHQAEQTRWYKDRGYEEATREETCWRGFFEEVKADRVDSHVERLSTPTGVARSSM